jgi:hypothetical protein
LHCPVNNEFAFSCVVAIIQLTVTVAVLTATESGLHTFTLKKTFELKSVLQIIPYLCIFPHKSYVLKLNHFWWLFIVKTNCASPHIGNSYGNIDRTT